jgi:hypothetical protein
MKRELVLILAILLLFLPLDGYAVSQAYAIPWL